MHAQCAVDPYGYRVPRSDVAPHNVWLMLFSKTIRSYGDLPVGTKGLRPDEATSDSCNRALYMYSLGHIITRLWQFRRIVFRKIQHYAKCTDAQTEKNWCPVHAFLTTAVHNLQCSHQYLISFHTCAEINSFACEIVNCSKVKLSSVSAKLGLKFTG